MAGQMTGRGMTTIKRAAVQAHVLRGQSRIVDSDGSVPGQLAEEEGVLTADVVMDPTRKHYQAPPSFGGWLQPGSWGAASDHPARHRGRPPGLHDQPRAEAKGTSHRGTDQRPGSFGRLTPDTSRLPVVTVGHEVSHRVRPAPLAGQGGHRGDHRRRAGPAGCRVRPDPASRRRGSAALAGRHVRQPGPPAADRHHDHARSCRGNTIPDTQCTGDQQSRWAGVPGQHLGADRRDAGPDDRGVLAPGMPGPAQRAAAAAAQLLGVRPRRPPGRADRERLRRREPDPGVRSAVRGAVPRPADAGRR
jgi:hypothetical protein